MKKWRQLHLWIGLFASFLILIEAITGLIMLEPWLIGENKPPTEQRVQVEKIKAGETTGRGAVDNRTPVGGEVSTGKDLGSANRQNNLMGFIRSLHSGRIGSTNLSIFLDIAAIALILITITGIILSVNILRINNIAKKKN